MGEANNFAAYRAELANFQGACLPFLGDFLTQIAQAHTFFAIRRKKHKLRQSPSSTRKESMDERDGVEKNGVTKCNGVILDKTEETAAPRPVSPRDLYSRHAKKEQQGKSRERVRKSSSRTKIRRIYGQQKSCSNGVLRTRSQNSNVDLLDAPEDNLDQTLSLSRSDSVITTAGSSNESPGCVGDRLSSTPTRPPLLRRLSESASSSGSISRGSETRRSFLRNFVKRSPSSHSMKEESVFRETSSEQLSHGVSTPAMREGCVSLRVERLAKAQSSPSVKISPSVVSRDVHQDSEQSSLSVKSSGTSIGSYNSGVLIGV